MFCNVAEIKCNLSHTKMANKGTEKKNWLTLLGIDTSKL